MADITFKKFNTFISMQDEPTDEQIAEMFGVFKNNKRIADLKKRHADMTAADRAEKVRKDAIMKAAAAKSRGQEPTDIKPDEYVGSSSARAAQARARSSDRDVWGS